MRLIEMYCFARCYNICYEHITLFSRENAVRSTVGKSSAGISLASCNENHKLTRLHVSLPRLRQLVSQTFHRRSRSSPTKSANCRWPGQLGY